MTDREAYELLESYDYDETIIKSIYSLPERKKKMRWVIVEGLIEFFFLRSRPKKRISLEQYAYRQRRREEERLERFWRRWCQ